MGVCFEIFGFMTADICGNCGDLCPRRAGDASGLCRPCFVALIEGWPEIEIPTEVIERPKA